jgi:hypothetical protein
VLGVSHLGTIREPEVPLAQTAIWIHVGAADSRLTWSFAIARSRSPQGRRLMCLQAVDYEPLLDVVSDVTPSRFQHHVVAHGGEEACVGAIRTGGRDHLIAIE